jgi:hypothetical protein
VFYRKPLKKLRKQFLGYLLRKKKIENIFTYAPVLQSKTGNVHKKPQVSEGNLVSSLLRLKTNWESNF